MSCYGPTRYINPSEIRQGDVEANEHVDLLKTKVLERSTAAEQVLHSLLRDENIEEVEMLELREKKGGHSINLGKIAGAEAGAAQRWREAEHGQWQRATLSNFKAELLELI